VSAAQLDHALRAAIAEGLLPATAIAPVHDERPWPVVLLTALGAWLAALPLIGLAALLLSGALRHGGASYVVGTLVLVGAIFVLRRPGLPLFVEQLFIPALIVGEALLGFGVFRDLQPGTAAGVLALVAIASALAIPRPWLRVVLGAAAATLAVLTWLHWHGGPWGESMTLYWLAWHVDVVVWLLAGMARRSFLVDGAQARSGAALESLRAGWLLATLAGLAWWSGMTFLAGASLAGGPFGDALRSFEDRGGSGGALVVLRAASLLLAVGAAAWAARCWPVLRNPASAGVAVVLVGLAALMPALGATLLVLSVCATGKRWRLAATAALTAAWIVGGFYYQLAWPLATKGGMLLLAGGVLGALAWLGFRSDAVPSTSSTSISAAASEPARVGARSWPFDRLGVAATALLVLIAANFAIWQKEALIARGEPVFVELAPVDPRSLMQGDFMRLNFRMPPDALRGAGGLLAKKRPFVVARRDARGVLTLLRIDRGEPLGADELRIELTPAHGEWVLVSDAWSFAEGEGARWAAARYGEFRVDSSGHALLVGLRGANLQAL